MEKITVHIPKDENKKLNSVKHHKADDWVKLIYYENRKEKMVFPDEVVNVYKSCDVYKKNCFYKVCSMSNKNNIWDFYRKLKSDVARQKNIGIEEAPTVKRKSKKNTNVFEIIHYPKGYKLHFD